MWYKTSAHPCEYVTVCTTRALKQGLARNGGEGTWWAGLLVGWVGG